MEIDVLEPLASVKTRTVLVNTRKVAMAENLSVGIVRAERLQKFFQSDHLRLGSGVFRTAVLVQTSFVADADAVGVVALGVSTHLVLGTTGIERSVLGDVVVVTDGAETTGLVAGLQLFDGEILVDSRRTAMHDDQRNVTWIFHVFLSFEFI